MAELLKLRTRRGLLWSTLAIGVGPVVFGYVFLAVRQFLDVDAYGAAGGVENLQGSLRLLALSGTVVATVVGVTAGGADVQAGVFRELVVTGRPRRALFAARIPGTLLFLAPFLAAALTVAFVASVALAGSNDAPSAALLVKGAGWSALTWVVAALFGLGIGSILSARVAVGTALAWQLALGPILLATGRIDGVLPNAALSALEPSGEAAGLGPGHALGVLVVWTVAVLAAGAWRTTTRDA
jgi:hypothetical protein